LRKDDIEHRAGDDFEASRHMVSRYDSGRTPMMQAKRVRPKADDEFGTD
jgi:hypothetical protein